MSDRTIRWAGAAGIAFVILVVISIAIGGSPPMADDAASKVRDYYVDHRSNLLCANFVGIIGIPFVLWFAVVFREMFRADRLASLFGTFSLAGLVVTAPMALIGGALSVSVIYVDGAAETYAPATLRLMYDAQFLAFAATSAGITAFALGAALATRRSGGLPRFVMWLAWLAVLGNVVAMFTVLDAGAGAFGLAGVLTFALFVLVTGITMVSGKATTPTAT
jgi:hypothetical protein